MIYIWYLSQFPRKLAIRRKWKLVTVETTIYYEQLQTCFLSISSLDIPPTFFVQDHMHMETKANIWHRPISPSKQPMCCPHSQHCNSPLQFFINHSMSLSFVTALDNLCVGMPIPMCIHINSLVQWANILYVFHDIEKLINWNWKGFLSMSSSSYINVYREFKSLTSNILSFFRKICKMY